MCWVFALVLKEKQRTISGLSKTKHYLNKTSVNRLYVKYLEYINFFQLYKTYVYIMLSKYSYFLGQLSARNIRKNHCKSIFFFMCGFMFYSTAILASL